MQSHRTSKWQDSSAGTSPQRVDLWAVLNLEKPAGDPESQGGGWGRWDGAQNTWAGNLGLR